MEDWLEQARKGDTSALQRLFMLYHERLRAQAESCVPAELRAKISPEDLLQQVYVEAIAGMGGFEPRGEGAFFGWLVRILESRTADAQRAFHAQRRDVGREVELPAARPDAPTATGLFIAAAVDTCTPSRVASARETEALVMAALAGLSADHRRVLELRYLKGNDLAEVARAMDRSPAAVQMLCARAVRELRDSLQRLSGIWGA